jgi:hypothetical protein
VELKPDKFDAFIALFTLYFPVEALGLKVLLSFKEFELKFTGRERTGDLSVVANLVNMLFVAF